MRKTRMAGDVVKAATAAWRGVAAAGPADSGTREAIRAAASEQFSFERGYDRPSMRSIAQQAGVDPALVSHFLGSKNWLFVDVVETAVRRRAGCPLDAVRRR